MSDNKTGGFAFPGFNPNQTNGQLVNSGGMTLRDWFAGMAMQGLMANPECWKHIGGTNSAETARVAFLHADAMLKARGAK